MRRLLILCLLLAAPAALATTYYVDPDGTDPADCSAGTTTGTAWKTIAKVNTCTGTIPMAGDDRVLFKRGGRWEGRLAPTGNGGTAGHPIVIGAYGTGAPPIIDGAVRLTSWTQYSGAVYWATAAAADGISTTIEGLECDGQMMIQRSSLVAVDNPGEWYWDSGASRIYLYSLDADRDGTVEAPSAEWTEVAAWKHFYGYYKDGGGLPDYITLQQLQFQRVTRTAINIISTQDGDTFQDLIVYCGMAWYDSTHPVVGINLGGTATANVNNVTILGCGRGLSGCIDGSDATCLIKDTLVLGAENSGMLVGDANKDGAYRATIYNSHVAGNALTIGVEDRNYYPEGSAPKTTYKDGGGTLATTTAPAVGRLQSCMATVTIDDTYGNSPDTLRWSKVVCARAKALGIPVAQAIISEPEYRWTPGTEAGIKELYDAGCELVLHGLTHNYYCQTSGSGNADCDGDGTDEALLRANIQYIGPGTTATVSVTSEATGGRTWARYLTTTVDGVTDLNLDLWSASYDYIAELCTYIDGLANYTCTTSVGDCGGGGAGYSTWALANVTAQDIKSATYTLRDDYTRGVRSQFFHGLNRIQTLTGQRPTAWAPTFNQNCPAAEDIAYQEGIRIARGGSADPVGSIGAVDGTATPNYWNILNTLNYPVYGNTHPVTPPVSVADRLAKALQYISLVAFNARTSWTPVFDSLQHAYEWDCNGAGCGGAYADGIIDAGSENAFISMVQKLCSECQCLSWAQLQAWMQQYPQLAITDPNGYTQHYAARWIGMPTLTKLRPNPGGADTDSGTATTTTDALGNTVPRGTARDIGAIEYWPGCP